MHFAAFTKRTFLTVSLRGVLSLPIAAQMPANQEVGHGNS
jgi:hypothetical protein